VQKMADFKKCVDALAKLDTKNMYNNDFFLTWEKTDDELQAVWAVADALRALRERNISTKVFDSGLGISLFRDNSTRTRFSFASACNLLGLEVQDLEDEIAGLTLRIDKIQQEIREFQTAVTQKRVEMDQAQKSIERYQTQLNDVKNNEIVMIQSIQWFDNKNGILKDAFLSRISSEHVYNTMKNDKISYKTKEKFINRVIELSSTNKELNKKYKSYKRYFLEGKGNKFTGEFIKLDNYFYVIKNKLNFYKNKGKENYPVSGENTPFYNWEELDKKVAEEAKERTNNNDYQIDNTYYDKYIRVKYNQLKDSSKNTKYDDSKEYEDLDLLLSIVKDLNLNIKFAIFPANGRWSDYTGIGSEKRQVAYNKLREIAKNNNIEVMDYSSKEYEDYYMYDAMHLGWRGWIDFERDLYKLKK